MTDAVIIAEGLALIVTGFVFGYVLSEINQFLKERDEVIKKIEKDVFESKILVKVSCMIQDHERELKKQ